MAINVGDYVRTKRGLIGKIIKCNSIYFILDIDKDNIAHEQDEIFKSSPNIIDLIEVGDLVNKKIVGCFRKENCDYDIGFSYNDDWGEWYGIDADEIESVITYEQIETMEYKIER